MPAAVGGGPFPYSHSSPNVSRTAVSVPPVVPSPFRRNSTGLVKVRSHSTNIAKRLPWSLRNDPPIKRLGKTCLEAHPSSRSPHTIPALSQDGSLQNAIQLLPKPLASTVSKSSSFKMMLNCLVSPNRFVSPKWPTEDYHVFEDVSTKDFLAIAFLAQNTTLFRRKPKLTYCSSDCTLIVKMPRSIHELPLTDLRDSINHVLDNLPYNKHAVRAKIEMNLPFRSLTNGFTATADLILFISSRQRHKKPQIPVVVECAFSQDRAILWEKMKKEIDAHPEVVLLIAIMITESPDYHSPEEDSDTWTRFVQEDTCRDSESFLDLKDGCAGGIAGDDQSLCVKIAGHVWCNVTSAEFYVWVRDETDRKIDVDCMQGVHGTLFPSIEMEEVTKVITLGLSKARDSIASFVQVLDPSISTTCLISAADLTAYERYQEWYQDNFRGKKRPRSSDGEYEDMRSDMGSDSSSSHGSPHLTVPPPSMIRTRSQKAARPA